MALEIMGKNNGGRGGVIINTASTAGIEFNNNNRCSNSVIAPKMIDNVCLLMKGSVKIVYLFFESSYT